MFQFQNPTHLSSYLYGFSYWWFWYVGWRFVLKDTLKPS